jgi:hypothetical protein
MTLEKPLAALARSIPALRNQQDVFLYTKIILVLTLFGRGKALGTRLSFDTTHNKNYR